MIRSIRQLTTFTAVGTVSKKIQNHLSRNALKTADLEAVYTLVKNDETESKDILVGFEKEYPTVAKESNIEDILKSLEEKQKK